jgi:hypothetical protein
MFISLNGFAQINDPAPYCATGYNQNYNMITAMDFNGTSFTGFGPVGTWTNPIPYRFFNNTTLNPISPGASFTLSIDFPSVQDLEPRYFAVWIDFNNNNIFEASELVMQNSNTINDGLPNFQPGITVTATKVITVPSNAVAGTTRMRIRRGQNQADLYGPYDSNVVLDPCSGFNGPQPAFGYNCTVDFNVTIQSSLSIVESDLSQAFKIFPVPVKDLLHIEKLSNDRVLGIQITDMVGKVVYKRDNNTALDYIDVSHLEKGVFMLTMHLENNQMYVAKFIKD